MSAVLEEQGYFVACLNDRATRQAMQTIFKRLHSQTEQPSVNHSNDENQTDEQSDGY